MKRFLSSLAGLLMAAVAMLTSCADDNHTNETSNASRQPIVLNGSIDQNYTTRVNDNGFVDGDAVGIYIVDYTGDKPGEMKSSGNRADNMKYTFDEAAYQWKPAYDVYWKDQYTHIDVYGYYPYSTPDNVKNYTFEVKKDQSKTAAYGQMGAYEASDFLWGKVADVAPTDQVIRLSFKHRMSTVRVTFQKGDGFSDEAWTLADKAVLVMNTKRQAIIDLTTGEITATGDASQTGIIPARSNEDFRAIVVPQTVAAGTPILSLTVAGASYSFTRTEATTFMQGKQYNFTMKVDKRTDGGVTFKLTSESITAWENDNTSHGAEGREYIIVNTAPSKLKEELVALKKDITKVKNLKITGKIDASDFQMMREEMTILQSLNLQEVEIEGNEIPDGAMTGKQSLLRLVLPGKITRIGAGAFGECANLTGSLIIPEGVKSIGDNAFTACKSMTGTLSLPSTLEEIGNMAFRECGFTCNLVLPSGLKYLKEQAFYRCSALYGSLVLPDGLKQIEKHAFEDCVGLTGSLEIPEGVTDIGERAFYFFPGGKFNGTLTLPEGLISIGASAFTNAGFRGELNLPKDLVIIPENAFAGCDFSGKLVIPPSVAVIGPNAFAGNWRLSGTLDIPREVQSIGANAFSDCRGIEGIIFGDGVQTIASGAFNMCTGIASIVCKATYPAYVASGAFDGVPKDNFTVEVPESVVAQYQTAVGWSDFKRISAYRNLVIRPAVATAINTSVTRDLVLNADDEWVVQSKPDWITLNQETGKGKADIKMTFAQMAPGAPREGKVVFKLKDKEYTTTCTVSQYDYTYAEDEIITLQAATKGKGVNLMFLGDGYNAKNVSDGDYLKNIKEAVEHYFNIEPYKTYRDYFNVYTGIAVSPESGIGSVNTIIKTRFNTSAKGGVSLGGVNGESDYAMIFDYATKAPTITNANLDELTVVMVPNTLDYGGICYMFDDGSAIAYCPMSDYGYPYDFRGVIQHEAGGHGFAKLADEYIYHNAFIDNCICTCCPHDFEFMLGQAKGWYQNLSLTGKMNEVPWSHLIFHDNYKQTVDVFEGGYMHTRGVYRSEQNSCMNNDIPYYSAISRETIVKRIKSIAGEAYNFNDFVANDKAVVEAPATRTEDRMGVPYRPIMHRHAPITPGKRPTL
ncbi:MAG: leucine-rich repeat protein [Prevotellaceae bacterium]|jgi:hypothetical protein|nr:leucine-rich repeat protein [Prevotellaceae bacterium]